MVTAHEGEDDAWKDDGLDVGHTLGRGQVLRTTPDHHSQAAPGQSQAFPLLMLKLVEWLKIKGRANGFASCETETKKQAPLLARWISAASPTLLTP